MSDRNSLVKDDTQSHITAVPCHFIKPCNNCCFLPSSSRSISLHLHYARASLLLSQIYFEMSLVCRPEHEGCCLHLDGCPNKMVGEKLSKIFVQLCPGFLTQIQLDYSELDSTLLLFLGIRDCTSMWCHNRRKLSPDGINHTVHPPKKIKRREEKKDKKKKMLCFLSVLSITWVLYCKNKLAGTWTKKKKVLLNPLEKPCFFLSEEDWATEL